MIIVPHERAWGLVYASQDVQKKRAVPGDVPCQPVAFGCRFSSVQRVCTLQAL